MSDDPKFAAFAQACPNIMNEHSVRMAGLEGFANQLRSELHRSLRHNFGPERIRVSAETRGRARVRIFAGAGLR
jgi:hypothetical protein